MAAITRNDLNSGVLQTFLNRKTLEVLEPALYLWKLGEKPMVEDGYNTIAWAKFDQIAATAVTAGTTSNDGVTPSDTDFDATVITVTPTQYRIVVALSDMVIERNVINFLEGAAKAVGDAMARKIDTVIQTTIMAGTNVKYSGTGNAARSDLASTDLLVANDLNVASAFLDSKNALKFDGAAYIGVIHPFQLYDLRSVSSAGSWMDTAKYVTPDKVFKGEIGMFCAVRIIVNPNTQTFASTTTVYPALVFGRTAYGCSSFQTLKTYVTPAVASDSDPLAQRRKVGAKVAFGVVILQQDCMVRLESAATSL
jgi:N4-gp56 family major capsid protein